MACRKANHSLITRNRCPQKFEVALDLKLPVLRMAAISNDDFLDTSGTENWNCKSRFQRTGSKHHRPSLFSDTRRKSCITDFETDLGKKR